MKPPPIYFWTEPIDGVECAAHARCRTQSRGRLLGISVFAIIPVATRYSPSYEMQQSVRNQLRAKINKTLVDHHYGHLPIIAYGDEIERVGIT